MKKKQPIRFDASKTARDFQALNPHLFAPSVPDRVGQLIAAHSPVLPTTAKKPRRSKEPNKTEREFQMILEARMRRGEFISVEWEAIKLRIGGNCYYSVDFTAITPEGRVCFFETKGSHVWDDSIVKFKSAKDRYKWATFELWQKKSGSWSQLL